MPLEILKIIRGENSLKSAPLINARKAGKIHYHPGDEDLIRRLSDLQATPEDLRLIAEISQKTHLTQREQVILALANREPGF
ncbi:hypothetical protein A2899_05155 [Candidatus Amesbacteria bacterium RIFCSPLOWO2_01_FULL_49_25]|uniref:Uncharacterized protein n=1 Tax=Candidatus Amesbacteria bacterium RIFCSPHIGHO2_01_FULL_48_32b TaxID=1797253 RepID=A0A1F4YF39_9BACT|nr:MAG: hypothetical protein A2876_02905 [Candidatus Amesbacteria bacterium RIFCSPHIGHO2_01_FULL_48_32b]OGD07816.1 MAG: hypothetical protein A2899_05155 [Candidatus Amesbacteria bacterium RIFCSPLOWO2_01_FULL_49_25]